MVGVREGRLQVLARRVEIAEPQASGSNEAMSQHQSCVIAKVSAELHNSARLLVRRYKIAGGGEVGRKGEECGQRARQFAELFAEEDRAPRRFLRTCRRHVDRHQGRRLRQAQIELHSSRRWVVREFPDCSDSALEGSSGLDVRRAARVVAAGLEPVSGRLGRRSRLGVVMRQKFRPSLRNVGKVLLQRPQRSARAGSDARCAAACSTRRPGPAHA